MDKKAAQATGQPVPKTTVGSVLKAIVYVPVAVVKILMGKK